MKINTHARKILLGFTVAAFLLTAVAQAADPTGNWTWTTPGRNGGPDRTNTLTLAVQDSKLNGKVSAPGHDGQAVETAISNGKVDGDNISFDLVRQFNGNSNTNKYAGAVTADEIVGTIEFNRNGETQTRKWEAKRVADTK
jgi:hypothetical protein